MHNAGKTVLAHEIQQPMQVIWHHDIAKRIGTPEFRLVSEAADNDSSQEQVLEYRSTFMSDRCYMVDLAGNGRSAFSQLPSAAFGNFDIESHRKTFAQPMLRIDGQFRRFAGDSRSPSPAVQAPTAQDPYKRKTQIAVAQCALLQEDEGSGQQGIDVVALRPAVVVLENNYRIGGRELADALPASAARGAGFRCVASAGNGNRPD
jgi:hypothetical protein